MAAEIYCDGGVISKNPSSLGGTWAWCMPENDQLVRGESGYITPKEVGLPQVTNNVTEMLALLFALESLPNDWIGTVYSDSDITLGRAFRGYAWRNVPLWIVRRFAKIPERMMHWEKLKHVLLAGHPTRAQLCAGVGKHGYPVSKWNVWCDQACGEQAEKFRQGIGPVNYAVVGA